MGERDASQVVALLRECSQLRQPVLALAAQRVERQQRQRLGEPQRAGRGRRGSALGGPAGRRDSGQPRGRLSYQYRHIRGDAAVAHSLLRLREKLPFLLCVTLSVYVPLRGIHLNFK